MRTFEKVAKRNIIMFIRDYHNTHHYAPSLAEISMGVGVNFKTVRKYVNELIDDGILESDHRGQPRCLRVNKEVDLSNAEQRS